MSTTAAGRCPRLKLLSNDQIGGIITEAKQILAKVGVKIHSREGLERLGDAGAVIAYADQRAYFPTDLLENALQTVPAAVSLYDRSGSTEIRLEGDNVFFTPTSSNIKVWDQNQQKLRNPLCRDLVDFTRITDALDHIAIQSANYYPVDIATEAASCFRHFICLRHSPKPIFGSIIPTAANFDILMAMLTAVRGSEQALREKPLLCSAVPTLSPLQWLPDNYDLVTRFARAGIPNVIAMAPAMGVSAPVTIIGSVTQLIAEFLSGVVISQSVRPGAPVLAGSYIEFFEMRLGTTCMGSMVNFMADMAAVEVVRRLNIPSLVFMGCSDAKRPDAQAGLESGMGMLLGALCGANIVQGAGGLSDVIPGSLAKLVIDNEICGMVYRLLQGVSGDAAASTQDLYSQGLNKGDHFLLSSDTLQYFRPEGGYAGTVLDRQSVETWREKGAESAEQRAGKQVKHILATHEPEPLDEDVNKALVDIMQGYARKFGMAELPVK